MNLTIDSNESPQVLRLTSKFLNDLADVSNAKSEEEPDLVFAAPVVEAPVAAPVVEQTAPVAAPVIEQTAPVTAPPVPGTEQTAPDVEVDAAGFPWDERIHSSGHTKKADGTWVRRRGVDKAVLEQVLAEYAAPAPVVEQAPAPVVEQAPAPVVDNVQPITQAAPQIADPTAVFGGGVAAPVVQAASAAGLTWPDVLTRVAAKQKDGTYESAAEAAFLAQHQVDQFYNLVHRTDLFGAFLQAVAA